LEHLITSETDSDEERSGYEVMQQQIASGLARWLGLPDPKITLSHSQSGPAYKAFVKRAKEKAATMANSSPY
jgi:streptomycin 6-kinase